jgi:hypothetical protein
MIIKDFLETRQDKVSLSIIYSDKNFLVREINSNMIAKNFIDITDNPNTSYVETTLKIPVKPIVEESIVEEIENGDQELTDEEAMELIKEVF